MISLLAKIFIHEKEITPEVRRKYGVLCGGTGIFLNVMLFLGKLFAGMVSGSVAVTADAFNNLSDAGSSIISMIGFKLAGQKPDSYHPFGHGRMEYVAGLIVSMLIILMGVELLKSGVGKIIHPEEVSISTVSVIILLASIAVKLYMYAYNRSVGNKIDSASMKATAIDSISDVCATTVVLGASVLGYFTNLNTDGWCGTAVALFILYAGGRAAYDTVSPLLGQKPSSEFVESVREKVLSHKEIMGVHDIVVHNYGPECVMVTLHAEVPADGDIMEMHDVIDETERELEDELNCIATIHMDPIVNDAATKRQRKITAAIVKEIDPRLTIHDFRMVDENGSKKVAFDVLAPFEFDKSDAEAAEEIKKLIEEREKGVTADVKVEKGYV